MRVDVTGLRNTLYWSFTPDKEDGRYTDNISMIEYKFSNQMPDGVSIDDVHPDHLALIALMVCHPFTSKSLTIPWKVSERFAKSCAEISKYSVSFEQGSVEPYTANGGRPALAFSGGADSTASLLVMPQNTLSVFMDRPLRKKVSMYNKSAAYATIKHAQKEGFEVLNLQCDVEYVRQPLGFPTDLVPSIPILALASSYDIDCVAFGTVMESAYRIGHEKARDYANSHHYRFWGRMFAAAGVPLFLPVSGVSEVGTSMIVMNSSFYEFTRSCIRGKWPRPCENCWKCFRKNMLDTRLNGNAIKDDALLRGLMIPEVQRKMKAFPVSHENVLAWALRDSEEHVSMMMMRRLEGHTRDLAFLETYYPLSLELMPEQYRNETQNSLESFLNPMKEQYWPEITKHSMTSWLESEEAKDAKRRFDEFILQQSSANQ